MKRAGIWRPARPRARAWSETAQQGDWPATMYVPPAYPAAPRAHRPARVGPVAWVLAKIWAGAILCAFGLLVAVVCFAVTDGRVLNALGAAILGVAGVVL